MRIATIGNTDRNLQAQFDVRVAPVFHLIGDKVFVGDQEFGTVAGANGGVTRAKRLNPAKCIANRNHVARLDRPVQQQDHAADQIGDNPLQTKPDADTDGTTKDSKRGQIDTDGRKRKQNRNRQQHKFQKLGHKHLNRWRQAVNLLDALFENARGK